jgi:hypothetical protein
MKSIEGFHTYEAGADNPLAHRGIPFQYESIKTLLSQQRCGEASNGSSANNDNVMHDFNLCFRPQNRFSHVLTKSHKSLQQKMYDNAMHIISNASPCQTLNYHYIKTDPNSFHPSAEKNVLKDGGTFFCSEYTL